MRGWLILVAAVALGWLASGVYVVRGNEKAAVRRLGRALRTPQGRLELATSGLHYGLPWPLAQVDRVNLNEVRTLAVGVAEAEQPALGGFLRSLETSGRSQFLTGDKNVLHMQIVAQYHVSEETADDFLFRAEAPEDQLERIVESVATGLVARCGVDFVHPLGQSQLNGLLTSGVRTLAAQRRLGLEVDDVTINAVYPPVLVKSYFLDVMSARAEKVNSVNAAHAYAEQRRAAAVAEVRRTLDEAASYRQQTVESARARAESFVRMIEQFQSEERTGLHSYADARQIALRRLYVETMRDILRSVSAKVLLDSGEPADLTIFGRPAGTQRPEARTGRDAPR
jgi:membrane protease subunit HflK